MNRPINEGEVNQLCSEIVALEKTKKEVDTSLKTAKEKLQAACQGKDEVSTLLYTATIKTSETWTWDKGSLESLLPDHPSINVKFSVDKDTFNALDKAEQAKMIHALTVTRGRVTVKVTPRNSHVQA